MNLVKYAWLRSDVFKLKEIIISFACSRETHRTLIMSKKKENVVWILLSNKILFKYPAERVLLLMFTYVIKTFQFANMFRVQNLDKYICDVCFKASSVCSNKKKAFACLKG